MVASIPLELDGDDLAILGDGGHSRAKLNFCFRCQACAQDS